LIEIYKPDISFEVTERNKTLGSHIRFDIPLGRLEHDFTNKCEIQPGEAEIEESFATDTQDWFSNGHPD